MVHDMLQQPLCPWQDGTGNFNDIVIDSRVRLDRNLKKYVFPDKASDTELAAVLEEGKRQIGMKALPCGPICISIWKQRNSSITSRVKWRISLNGSM